MILIFNYYYLNYPAEVFYSNILKVILLSQVCFLKRQIKKFFPVKIKTKLLFYNSDVFYNFEEIVTDDT